MCVSTQVELVRSQVRPRDIPHAGNDALKLWTRITPLSDDEDYDAIASFCEIDGSRVTLKAGTWCECLHNICQVSILMFILF